MHVYWRKDQTHELKKPVSGRPAHEVAEPTRAAIVWEMPYWNASRSAHPWGIHLLFADNHAQFEKRSPKEYDWYFIHSRRGWDETGVP